RSVKFHVDIITRQLSAVAPAFDLRYIRTSGSPLLPIRIKPVIALAGFEDRVVLDIGSLYIKCGLSGESKPRHIVPITVPVPYAPSVEMSRSGSKLHGLYTLTLDPAQDDFRKQLLLDHLIAVYNKYLLTDPKQRKVIICENALMPLKLKETLALILLEVLQVPSITFMPSSLLALLTTGTMTGLVIDSGHLETVCVPIYDGRPLIHFVTTIPKAGDSLTARLKLLIRGHGVLLPETPHHTLTDHMIETIAPEVWEDMKSRVCFVGKFPRQEDVSGDNREQAYPYRERMIPYTIYKSEARKVEWRLGPGEKVVIPGWVRERAAEVLFEGDEDGDSVASIALDAVLKCPPDIRAEIVQNILLVGGTSMLPGFQSRLMEHMAHILEERPAYSRAKRLAPRLKFARTIFTRNCSIVGALKTTGIEVTREAFARDKKIPDWTVQDWGNGASEE
ncbi:Actin- protein 10, partial [Irineochytrium annulatum]